MATRDLVLAALSSPMDWNRFESMVAAVLVQDDFPRLKKLGGQGDRGVDGVDEAFYSGARKIEWVVQVTSQRAQQKKVASTIEKLRVNGVSFSNLLFVSQHPVSSDLRRQLIDEAADLGITLEVRDQDYLASQLSKSPTVLFARFFGDLKTQVDALFAKPDPLGTATSRPSRALLATLGAYVLGPRTRLTRETLFEKTVLASVASIAGEGALEAIVAALKELLPEENVAPDRVRATLDKLTSSGDCKARDGKYVVSEQAAGRLASAATLATRGYSGLMEFVLSSCASSGPLDDATRGYIERNVRRALLCLLRAAGPVGNGGASLSAPEIVESNEEVRKVIAADLPADVSRTALIALGAYVRDSNNAEALAPFIRTYAALAIRNLDPLGRRWQQTVLGRSCIALDTDAVLMLTIEELPEHHAFISAVRNLADAGMRIVIAEHVLEEALNHISRADRTFRRFADSLLRMPSAAVDEGVWHAIVRGYYYAAKNGYGGSAEQYWKKYYDKVDPERFLRHVLGLRAPIEVRPLNSIPDSWQPLLYELEEQVLAKKEVGRLKAEFRDMNEMAARVRQDVRMALSLAATTSASIAAGAKGYLVSEDRAFAFLERQLSWRGKEKVLILSRGLPELAAFICGTTLSDDDIVRLLFNPASAAAAAEMADEITVLAEIGVELSTVPLTRLEFDLSNCLRGAVAEMRSADEGAPLLTATERLANLALATGYSLAAPVRKLLAEYETTKSEAATERTRRLEAEDKLKTLASAARGKPGRSRRRMNRLLKELQIDLGGIEAEEEPVGQDQSHE